MLIIRFRTRMSLKHVALLKRTTFVCSLIPLTFEAGTIGFLKLIRPAARAANAMTFVRSSSGVERII